MRRLSDMMKRQSGTPIVEWTAVRPVRNTRKDPNGLETDRAIRQMHYARHYRALYQTAVDNAIAVYGDAAPDYPWMAHAGDGSIIPPGCRTLIAGVYRRHFPHAIKAQLRALATWQTTETDHSVASWRAAGRTMATWRKYLRLNDLTANW